MDRCKTLAGYSYFVSKIRSNLQHMSLEDAVKMAVEECINEDVLKEFLLEQKAEVIAMSIYEYNEEYARKAFFEKGVENGYAQGVDIGNAKRLVQSVENLMKNCDVYQDIYNSQMREGDEQVG